MRSFGMLSLFVVAPFLMSFDASASHKKDFFEDIEEKKEQKMIKKEPSNNLYAQAEKYQTLGDAQLDLGMVEEAATSYLKSAEIVWDNEDLHNFFNRVNFKCTAKNLQTKKGFTYKENELAQLLMNFYKKNH